jgi:cytochrome b561
MALTILTTTALMFYMINIGDLTLPANRAEYGKLLKTHKSLGLLVLLLVTLRFAWNRLKKRPPLLADLNRGQLIAQSVSHSSLYLLMLLVPLIGWMASMTYGGRTLFFGLFELPVWLPKSIEWANILQPAHIRLAYGMLAIIGIHMLAALWHHFIRKDPTLVQMMPKSSDEACGAQSIDSALGPRPSRNDGGRGTEPPGRTDCENKTGYESGHGAFSGRS